ncbi:hypothetical protein PENTCL1PPCAC_7849, partial [Pristionchus entomophagus]
IVFLALAAVSAVLAEDAANPFPTSINGNVGLVGSGYGDVYGGKIKEGVYGAGGRVGGNLGLVGSAGLGRRKRQAVLDGASASAGAIASGPDSFSMAGAAAGSGSIGFGSGAPGAPAAATAAPAAPAATTKKCPSKRHRRSSAPAITPIRNETVTRVVQPVYPFPIYPMMIVPPFGFPMPAIPEGTHGVSTNGQFKFTGTATVENDGQIRISGTRIVDGDTNYF